MTEHDLTMMAVNGEWQLRDGLRSSREHPEKARVYEVADCTFGVMKFGEKVCAMFSLPLKVRK